MGLIGFAITSMIFAFVEGLSAIYTERALSGLFVAAVTPVAAAAVGKRFAAYFVASAFEGYLDATPNLQGVARSL